MVCSHMACSHMAAHSGTLRVGWDTLSVGRSCMADVFACTLAVYCWQPATLPAKCARERVEGQGGGGAGAAGWRLAAGSRSCGSGSAAATVLSSPGHVPSVN